MLSLTSRTMSLKATERRRQYGGARIRKKLRLISGGAVVALALMGMAAPTGALAGGASRAGVASTTATTWAPGCNGGPITWSQHPPELAFTCGGPTAIVVHLRWRHWGNATAQASGTYEYAGCTPNCAQARRHRAAATVVASNIGYCGTRRVYGEINVRFTRPSRLKNFSQPTVCSYTGQRPTSRPATKPAASNPTEFYARPPGGYITCGIVGGVSEEQLVRCQGAPVGSNPLENVATLQPDGHLETCSRHQTEVRCFEGNVGENTPTLSAGAVDAIGPFTCKVLATGVECTVTTTGRGFLITPASVTEVGG
jgi:hypothetical protein